MSTENRPMARADLASGLVFVALGLAVTIGSWTMPRLENRGVDLISVPGLVPFFLGILLTLCGVILAWRSIGQKALGPRVDGEPSLKQRLRSPEAVRWCTLVVLALIYTLILVDRVPYWLATFSFLWVTTMVFETWLKPEEERKPLMRAIVVNLIIASLITVSVVLTFQEAFLIRLP